VPPHLFEFLTYGQVVDCSRLHRDLGWRPHYGTRAVVEEFAANARTPATAELTAPNYRQEKELQRFLSERGARARA
jgi:hypothetical protein